MSVLYNILAKFHPQAPNRAEWEWSFIHYGRPEQRNVYCESKVMLGITNFYNYAD